MAKGIGTILRVGAICRAREREAPWGSGGFAPSGIQVQSSWSEGLGARSPPEAESFFDVCRLYVHMIYAVFQNKINNNKKKQFEVGETYWYSIPRIYYDEAFLGSNVYSYRLYASGLSTITSRPTLNTYSSCNSSKRCGLHADHQLFKKNILTCASTVHLQFSFVTCPDNIQ